MKGEKASISYFEMEPGAQSPLHDHDNEQINYVLEGEIEFTSGEQTEILRVGKVVVFAPYESHLVRNVGTLRLRATSVSSVLRDMVIRSELTATGKVGSPCVYAHHHWLVLSMLVRTEPKPANLSSVLASTRVAPGDLSMCSHAVPERLSACAGALASRRAAATPEEISANPSIANTM
ncbi:cupin domain-containing protein [Chloroflexota bacterium]